VVAESAFNVEHLELAFLKLAPDLQGLGRPKIYPARRLRRS
jgi:hypothetical protein